MGIDICITATLRPEILYDTLYTFTKNLFGVRSNHRAMVNIDPVGDKNATQEQVAEIVKFFFPRYMINMPLEPSFPKATLWGWDQVESEFFFNMEDDWELRAPLDLNNMIEVMRRNPDLASLRIPKRAVVGNECIQSDSINEPRYVWTGEYFKCPESKREKENYYGGPSLLRTAWVHSIRQHLTSKHPMERNLHRMKKRFPDRFKDWRFGVYSKLEYSKILVDIGTTWRRKKGLVKNSYHGNFITWVDKEK